MFNRITSAFQHVSYDILREIMRHAYTSLVTLCEGAESDGEVLLPPVQASQVCRSWRRPLLSDPTMWTCFLIPRMSPKWMMELLHRSDSSLLNVFLVIRRDFDAYKICYNDMSSVLSVLFQQIHRFRILRVQTNDWGRFHPAYSNFREVFIPQLLSYLQRPAPELQTLSFRNYFDYVPDSSPDHAVMNKFFSGDAPKLKRVHHRLSHDLRELNCFVFHGLSQLHLVITSNLNFDLFLDLLALSPCLKLLCLDTEWNIVSADFEHPSDRKVSLPFLEMLRLELVDMIELRDLVLKHVILPLNVKWHITSMYYPDVEESPFITELLSGAHFASLHIRVFCNTIWLIFEEEPNKDHVNRFTYTYEDIQGLVGLWDRVSHTFKSSSRTVRLELESNNGRDYHDTFPTFLTSMSSLKSLIIRPSLETSELVHDADELCLSCLTALTSDFQDSEEAPGRNTDTANPTQDLVLTDSEDIHTRSTTPLYPCPLLREITVEHRDPVDTKVMEILGAFSDLRRNAGYPLQIYICCPGIKQGGEEILRQRNDDSIKISLRGEE